MKRLAGAILGVFLLAHVAAAQFAQQGTKLVGTGTVGAANQGAVAISADGTTAIVGGWFDNAQTGATWVFTRSGGVWSQQGAKLVGTGAVGTAAQGSWVAVSADGNTAIVGGPGDNGGIGAAWVFTRSGGVWSQQGSKLVGTGAVGRTDQGSGVAISADGNTALVGATADNNGIGAVWVFTRNGGVWTQQGAKLVGTGTMGIAQQGGSVAISSDGNTAISGGFADNSHVGAVWVFTRNGGVWTQQGSKLVGADEAGAAWMGSSVAISADGNTAISGGWADNSSAGAAWVFTRSGGVWSQQGSKLVGAGAAGSAEQSTVAISADGNTAIVGGEHDNSGVRRGVGLHPQRRGVDAAGEQARRHGRSRGGSAGLRGRDLCRWRHRDRGRVCRQLEHRRRVGVLGPHVVCRLGPGREPQPRQEQQPVAERPRPAQHRAPRRPTSRSSSTAAAAS